MNTHSDPFERELQTLQRRALPADWRDEMLRAAKPAPHAPRWLVAGWSTAWAAILVMYFSTPIETTAPPSATQTAPVLRWEERAAMINSLLAAN